MGMKPKVHYQIQPRQSPPEAPPPANQFVAKESAAKQDRLLQVKQEKVREEISAFLQALDSYPARAAKDRGVSFRQHLRSVFNQAPAVRNNDVRNNDVPNNDGQNRDGSRHAPPRRH